MLGRYKFIRWKVFQLKRRKTSEKIFISFSIRRNILFGSRICASILWKVCLKCQKFDSKGAYRFESFLLLNRIERYFAELHFWRTQLKTMFEWKQCYRNYYFRVNIFNFSWFVGLCQLLRCDRLSIKICGISIETAHHSRVLHRVRWNCPPSRFEDRT